MNLSDRIETFVALGEFLKTGLHERELEEISPDSPGDALFRPGELKELVKESGYENPWFTPFSIYHALRDTCRMLERQHIEAWIGKYPGQGLAGSTPKKVGTILAGNIPLVGFHDFLSILIAGHRFIGKTSGKDDKLLPYLGEKLSYLKPGFSKNISFVDERLGGIDAIIATGSNNTSRYFEYYFGKYPHIFRKNRNGVAVLSGNESGEELALLADDIFLYFGLGCRNVAKLYVPDGYDFSGFFPAMEKYQTIRDHHKYANNFLYRRSIFLMNQVRHLDNDFLLVSQDKTFNSPISVLHYEEYRDLKLVGDQLAVCQDEIQIVVSDQPVSSANTPFGQSQHPRLWDYADNVDTLGFLSNLSQN